MSIYFDFTPDPRVLLALANTPMQPLDALCELIDNSIDSFDNAKLQGIKIQQPVIWIDLPKKADIANDIGLLRIRDNGPGMTAEQAEKAIRAGYSGNNSYDTLGLFGMGFNISTSKLGRVTTFLTCRPGDTKHIRTVIDLEKINNTKSYTLEAEEVPVSPNFTQGTIIEISHWWPEGNPNNGFIKKLLQYGPNKIRQELGRRYATILRDKQIRILVDKEPCEAFEHCVWDSKRFVERNGKQIPARFDFDKVLNTERRCGQCRAILPDNVVECPSCHSRLIRTIEERIKGWVGIQRFDDASNYGIDLIRNGRAIRPGEKSAFFEFTDEFKKVIKDYPVDGVYGRIVGEVHLDFVPVDFLKQDFQRSSAEWQRAMTFLRGESSLQPKQPGADKNDSVVFKLFQGYRKVRDYGKVDMYMGFWDPVEKKAKRISRETEREFYEKFLKKEPGYYDDAKWWEKVEEASRPPIEPLVECPDCLTQNLKEAEVCCGCGKVLIGKDCPNCGEYVAKSAVVCPKCGASLIPKVSTPWTCAICGTSNKADATVCSVCGKDRGTENPLTEEALLKSSNKDDSLSIDDLFVKLANGTNSSNLKVETYQTTVPLVAPLSQAKFPMVIFKSLNTIRIFIDPTHPILSSCNISPEELIANELAGYIYDVNRNQAKYAEHSISNIAWQILSKYWLDRIELSYSKTVDGCSDILANIKNLISENISDSDSAFLYEEMSDRQSKEFVAALFENNIPMSLIGKLQQNGGFIRFVPNDFLLQIFDLNTDLFFNGTVWDEEYNVFYDNVNSEALSARYQKLKAEYRNSLETIILFVEDSNKDDSSLKKAEAALDFLKKKIKG